MKKILLLNGPNLNRLGKREPDIYGIKTLEDIEQELSQVVKTHHGTLQAYQSNHEGELIDFIHQSDGEYDGIIFNPGAYTHTSIALRDAISSIAVPVIEVHISNVHQRESFRHTSLLAPVCQGQIVGLGIKGYELAALAFLQED
ncbi:type II 3-dehydroquinate dehydratase [Aquibacillus rhizosphaerae]|uniref:3-dehydroquinate dehydratase n=1 Tax=Aquibacillus rhizosphaerae TaxID=3051431 RepID=A0ABT7L6U7_9BACI|nr:type II 3-dehydroquinate dehydratase [Aquibacillus sp. LR5S19]MDL4841578.1 type II 3-dehydroquinate dehydratase [Aquibacillus sp. LR5S19]